MGRPITEGSKKEGKVSIRISTDHLAILDRMAKENKMGRGQYIRFLILQEACQ
jgi:hypothetical protein